MNEKQAKALRRALLPNPREQVGASRGAFMKGTTQYEIRPNPGKNSTLVLAPQSPRGVYQHAKRRIINER